MFRFIYIALPLLFFFQFGTIHEGHRFALSMLLPMILASIVKEKAIKYTCYYLSLYIMLIQGMYVFGMIPFNVSIRTLTAAHFLSMALIIYITVARSYLTNEKIYNMICIGAVIQLIIGLLQPFKLDPILIPLGYFLKLHHGLASTTSVGTLGNPNFLAAYIVIAIPFFFRKTRIKIPYVHFLNISISQRYLYLNWRWFLVPIVYLLSTLQTTTAVISALVGMMYYFKRAERHEFAFKPNYYILAAVSVVTFILFVIIFEDQSIIKNERWEIWTSVFQTMSANWRSFFIGFGPGMMTPRNVPIHNEWISLLYQYGMLPVILMAWYVHSMIYENRMIVAALIIAAVNCMGNYPMHLIPSAFLIIVIMGLLERERHGRLSTAIRHKKSGSVRNKG